MVSRIQRRVAAKIEAKALVSGKWPPWESETYPGGTGVGNGWLLEVRRTWRNGAIAVLERPLSNGVTHLAIRTVSQLEPTWAELQRIKNEIMGEDRPAVQIYPRVSRLIDEADMYHLWVYAADWEFGFGLHKDDAPAIRRTHG